MSTMNCTFNEQTGMGTYFSLEEREWEGEKEEREWKNWIKNYKIKIDVIPKSVRPLCLTSNFGASAKLESAHGVWHVDVNVI